MTMTQWKPKQLEWVYSEQDKNHYGKILFSNKNLYTIGCSSNYIWVQGEGMGGTAKNLQVAKKLCQDHFNERWQAMADPQPFWKPIEQCPKVEGVKYDLHITQTVKKDYLEPSVRFKDCTFKENNWYDMCGVSISDIQHLITHYAEIPPLEASNAKV